MKYRSSILCIACAAAIAALSLCPCIYAQSSDDLFPGIEKFSKGATAATDVTLDKNMLGMAGALGGQMGYFAGKLKFITVHDYTYPRPDMYSMADVEAVERRLNKPEWHHIVHDRDKAEVTDICVKVDDEGQWNEMVVIDAEPTELSFIHLEGHVSMADLKHLGDLGNAAPDPKLTQRPR